MKSSHVCPHSRCFGVQEGIGNLSLKITESAITSVLILLVVLSLFGTFAFAATDSQQWSNYLSLFEGSRLVASTASPSLLFYGEFCSCLGDRKER